jgi:diadenosine tetraphosphate (Ap4A) HIT family hydrolase
VAVWGKLSRLKEAVDGREGVENSRELFLSYSECRSIVRTKMNADIGVEFPDDCPFCSLPPERIVKSSGEAVAILDAYPVTYLHTLVIPRRHILDYFALSEHELVECSRLLDEMRRRLILEDSSIEGFNIGVNVGNVAGQTVPHCHIHLIPRRFGDVEDPRGGVRHVIPGKGYY